MQSQVWPRLQILATAVLFSTGGAGIKGNAFTDWQVASFRCLVAAIAMLLLIPESRRGWSWRMLPVSVSYAATLLLFSIATKRTTAANAIYLQSIAPAYLVVLSPLILREQIRRSELYLLAGLGLGFSLLVSAPHVKISTAPDPVSGNVLAVLSGVTWALTVMGLRWFGRSGPVPIPIVAIGNVLGFAAALPMALPVGEVGIRDIGALLYLGLIQISLAYYLLTRAIQSVTAFEAATLMLLEPALNPLWAWLAVGERPAELTLIGGAVIIGVSLMHAWWQNRSVPAR